QAYHAWDLTPSKRGCFVTTDETQHGIMPAVLGPLLKRRMLELHDRWLRDLEARARELEGLNAVGKRPPRGDGHSRANA
ncbi:MAG: hypothetical protein IAI50_08435, partial [Candidatus Eremiobacteraeota bacterium]|nr:hypothetical protein [Candidatus Eremiobacteraeota bacterium]